MNHLITIKYVWWKKPFFLSWKSFNSSDLKSGTSFHPTCQIFSQSGVQSPDWLETELVKIFRFQLILKIQQSVQIGFSFPVKKRANVFLKQICSFKHTYNYRYWKCSYSYYVRRQSMQLAVHTGGILYMYISWLRLYWVLIHVRDRFPRMPSAVFHSIFTSWKT